jgi:multisubunit Na+/H+ antiporter MnhC subunit
MSGSLQSYLFISTALFSIGIFGLLSRRNLVAMLISLELILNSAGLNFVAFNRFARTADAGQVGRRLAAAGDDLAHGVERALLGAAAGAEGDREIGRLELGQLVAHRAQLLGPFRRLRRIELDAEIMSVHCF